MRLDSLMEVTKLTHELQVDEDLLAGLDVLDAADLRRLRRIVSDGLHGSHQGAFRRLAQVSAMLPIVLAAKLAEAVLGPYLTARIAAELTPERAAKVAMQLAPEFLADVCLSLDPMRVADTIRRLPDDRLVAVSDVLLGRGEYATLGKFTDLVPDHVIDRVMGTIDDPMALLEIGVGVEARERIDPIVSLLDDRRLREVIEAAFARDSVPLLLAIIKDLGRGNRARTASLAAAIGPEVLKALLEALASVGSDWTSAVTTELRRLLP